MRPFAPLLALSLFVVCGCHKATVVGKWKVDPAFVKAHENDEPKGFITGFASTFTYEFKDDNTFKGSMSQGTYTFKDGKIEITTTNMMGKDIAAVTGKAPKPQMTGELGSDGKTLTIHPPAEGKAMLPSFLQTSIPMVLDSGS